MRKICLQGTACWKLRGPQSAWTGQLSQCGGGRPAGNGLRSHLGTSVRCPLCEHCGWVTGPHLQTSWRRSPLETTWDQGSTVPGSTAGGRAWQLAWFGILLCVPLLHRAICNLNLIQSAQTFHCIRHILSPFPEPPRKPSLVACQTGCTPYVCSSVSVVGCHSPIEPHVQNSGC